MKKILPFQFTDYLFTYNYGIHYYGILLNNPEGAKLLYNQYIIPYLFDDGSYQEMNYYFLSDNTPVELDPNKGLPPIFEEKVILNKETTKSFKERKLEFLDLVKNTIDEGKYFIGWWDEFYVSGTHYYNSKSFSHDYCIIGYDDSCFYSVGYYSGKPQVISVAYDDFFQANDALSINHALIWTLNPKYIFNLDLKMICKGIESYISGVVPNTENRDYSLHVFGKNVLYKLSEIIERDNYIDIRFIHTLKQQKLLMKERIEHIYRTYSINDKVHLETLNKIYEQISIIFNLCLKLNITGSNSISVNISNGLKKIVQEESVYFEILKTIKDLL